MISTDSFSGPLASLGYWLWHANLRWTAAVTAALAPLDLTPVQFFVLGGTAWRTEIASGGCTQIDLATHTGLDPAMTSKVLRVLERRNLVRRTPDPDDARARRVTLTAEGEALLERAKPLIRATDRTFFGPASLEPSELRSLLANLARESGTP